MKIGAARPVFQIFVRGIRSHQLVPEPFRDGLATVVMAVLSVRTFSSDTISDITNRSDRVQHIGSVSGKN
jgi:hypothetical protein